MSKAMVVIAGSLVALALIYCLPWFDERIRKMYGRWRRRQRDLREEKARQERLARRAQSR